MHLLGAAGNRPLQGLCKPPAKPVVLTELTELLKNVELKTIIGAGHEVNIESPQELAEILHAFYERMS